MHHLHYKKPLVSGKGKTSSVSGLNNYWEAKINGVHFTCPLGSTALTPQDLTESEQYYPFVPHSHAILYFCFLNFSSLVWVLLRAFLTEFYFIFRILYPIVSFCVNDIFFYFNSRTERILWPCVTLCFEIYASWSFALLCFVPLEEVTLKSFLTLFLIHGMGSFICDKLCHSVSILQV